MDVFRKALERGLFNEALRDGDQVWFEPARQFVPIAWIEQMVTHEFECSETGGCNHPTCRTNGCYNGRWVGEGWICESLLMDGKVLIAPVEVILSHW